MLNTPWSGVRKYYTTKKYTKEIHREFYGVVFGLTLKLICFIVLIFCKIIKL